MTVTDATTLNNAKFTPNGPGVYTVHLKVTDACGNVDDAEMTQMTPAQLQEELASFEAASCGLQLEAEESVAHLEANLRELQAAAPGIAQRQFGKVNAEINAELVRRNAGVFKGETNYYNLSQTMLRVKDGPATKEFYTTHFGPLAPPRPGC